MTFALAITHQKHLAQSGCSLGTVRGVQWTFSIHSAYLLNSQSEKKNLVGVYELCLVDDISHSIRTCLQHSTPPKMPQCQGVVGTSETNFNTGAFLAILQIVCTWRVILKTCCVEV